MFEFMNFSNRQNIIILLLRDGFELGNLAKEVKIDLGDLPRLSEDEEVEVFNQNDFSIEENIIIELMVSKVDINFLYELLKIALIEIDNGCDISESVRIAKTHLNKQISFSNLELKKLLSNVYYAGWNESDNNYNCQSYPQEEGNPSFCQSRNKTIVNIITSIKQ